MIPKSFHPITTREKYCKRVAGKSINISVKSNQCVSRVETKYEQGVGFN